jgi:hypothetical protein
MSKKNKSIYLLLALGFLVLAQPSKTLAAGLNQDLLFNKFLSGWIDVFFYIFSIIFIGLGLANLEL